MGEEFDVKDLEKTPKTEGRVCGQSLRLSHIFWNFHFIFRDDVLRMITGICTTSK
jgi:hypothetical protein